MARKTTKNNSSPAERQRYDNPPQDLSKHIFYGLKLDEEQKALRDAIWNPDIDIVFCNSIAGSGKTLIAIATANLLVEYGLFRDIYYINAAGTFEERQGYLPGGEFEKSKSYTTPLFQAVERLDLNPYAVISDGTMEQGKQGTAYIFPMTNSYIRGMNIGRGKDELPSIALVEEAQNFDEKSLRTVLSRINEGSRAIVIGHTGQIDLPNPEHSGFEKCIKHFMSKGDGRAVHVQLKTNHRGYISRTADEPWE